MTQRLIGAIVLIGLTVIFLPMLLRGNREPQPVSPVSTAPPAAEFSSSITPLLEELSPSVPGKSDIDAPPAGFLTTPAQPVEQAEPQPNSAAMEEGRKQADREQEPRAAVIDTPKPVPKKPAAVLPKAEDIAKNMDSGIQQRQSVDGWVVQMGVFGSEQNAIKLRDKLRNQGQVAFMEELAVGGARQFRVRIGPESTRARADGIRDTLEKQMQIKGIVKPYDSVSQ